MGWCWVDIGMVRVRYSNYYASRRSRTRDTVKLTVCLSVPAVCSTVAMRRKLTASSHVLLDLDSWICKLKLCSRVMATGVEAIWAPPDFWGPHQITRDIGTPSTRCLFHYTVKNVVCWAHL